MSFPEDPLGLAVELRVDGAWLDITGDVRGEQGIAITRGQSAWGETVDPGSLAMTLDNRDGTYSARNPMSDLFGKIGRNTLARVSAPGEDVYLDLDGTADRIASAAATDALQIAGDLDVRAEVTTNWRTPDGQQTIIGRYADDDPSSYWLLWINKGALQLRWYDTTAEGFWFSERTVPDDMPARAAVRVVLDVDDGSSETAITWYWSDSIDGTWTQVGNVGTVASITVLPTGDTPLTVAPALPGRGRMPLVGQVHAVQVRDGIDGTLVAAADFTAQSVGATSFTDDAELGWTVGTGALTNRSTRFHGEINAWPVQWSAGGGDVYVPVQGAGIMRRLGQGASPLDSPLRRRIPSADGLVAYWPLEDGGDATQAASPIPGVQPLRVTGFSFGSDTTMPGASTLPVLGDSSSLAGAVPGATAGAWHVEMVYNLDALPATERTFLTLQLHAGTGGITQVRVRVSTGGVRTQALNVDGSVVQEIVSTDADAIDAFASGWNRLQIFSATSDDDAIVSAAWRDVGADTWWYAFVSYTGTPGTVVGVKGSWGADFQGMALGHLGVFDVGGTAGSAPGVTVYNGADDGFSGEEATTRYTRLTTEEGIPAILPYGTADTATMGPQRPNTALDLLQEGADADAGILYEARDTLALAYRPRTSLYNQTPALTLDYTTDLAPGLQPTEDDTATRNDITVSRPSGSSARATLDTGALSTQSPPNGVGRYTTAVTRNVETDDQLPGLAGWLLHLGTWDEARYPQVTVNLAANPGLIGAVAAVDIGDLIVITNPPPWLPPGDIRLMVRGYRETLGTYEWTVTFNCGPAGPWTVGVVGDDVLGRVDTGGSVLAAAVDADDTALSVSTVAGRLWTTDPDHYPLTLRVGGGEVVTATACTGTSSPQTMTVTRAVNGISRGWAAGDDVRLATPMIVSL